MAVQRPFLTAPNDPNETNAQGEQPRAAYPEALFNLAVNRAHTTLHSLGLSFSQPDPSSPTAVQTVALNALTAWHARTRFARRIPLTDIQRALSTHPVPPDQTNYHWTGGPQGHWQAGKAPFP